MGKTTGFIEWPRRLPKKQAVSDRLKVYREFYLPQDPAETRRQGGRCMDCGVPFCQQGCPLGNHIPDWNDYVYRDRWEEAYRRLDATNNFPEFTGRLCPAPCEAACTLSINQDPVTIEQMEKEIIERAYAQGWVKAQRPAVESGKRIAVVGSGPAGLAAAAQLRSAGHQVTVYEAADRIGGLLRYGIPDFKMEKRVIDRRLALMKASGIELRTGVRAGTGDHTWDRLADTHDAVVVAIGAERPRDLDVPGRDKDGVCLAMEFLTRQNRLVAGDGDNSGNRDSAEGEGPSPDILDASGKDVIILGGGDTGSDCYGTALRQGARSVTQIELFPEPPRERLKENPWPQWPVIFRTSSSQEEGGSREFACMTRRILGDDRVTGIELARIEVANGAPRPVPGSEFQLPCDLLILAIGFVGHADPTIEAQLGLESERGKLVTDGFRTSREGIYVAGDASRGASLIVWAISDGREAARVVDRDLRDRNDDAVLPTRGVDCPFGGR